MDRCKTMLPLDNWVVRNEVRLLKQPSEAVNSSSWTGKRFVKYVCNQCGNLSFAKHLLIYNFDPHSMHVNREKLQPQPVLYSTSF